MFNHFFKTSQRLVFSLAPWYFEKNFKFFVLLFISLTNFCHWQRVNSYSFPVSKTILIHYQEPGERELFPHRRKEGRGTCAKYKVNIKKSYYITSIFLMSTCPTAARFDRSCLQGSATDVTNAHEVKLTSEALTCFPIFISLHRCNLLMLKPKRRFLL